MRKAVLIRLDKIGDLLCTLPVDQTSYLQDWDVTWIIAKGLRFVPDHALPRRKYLELDKSGTPEARAAFDDFLKNSKPELAISFQAPWWVHYALWKNRVARRIGVLSKWHSFLFLNEGVRQKRSEAKKHEADYNLDLVRKVSERISTANTSGASSHSASEASSHSASGASSRLSAESTAPFLTLEAPIGAEVLKAQGLAQGSYDVVHPGMAGSARNWPVARYIELIRKLIIERQVVLTGTPADEEWLTEIKRTFATEPRVVVLQNKLSAQELLQILKSAHQVFAPSTGVLHLAAALGVRTVGIYSPVQVQSITRWGARGQDVHLYSPNVPCPATHKCHGPACPFYDCMNLITPEQVLGEKL